MENIFENAYFGKAYKTRDGRKAIFIKKDTSYNFPYAIIIEGDIGYVRYDNTAKYINDMPQLDIVSEWSEEINEDEYEDKIKSLIDSCIYWETYEDEPELFAEAFKELLDFAPNDKRTIDYCSDMIKSRKTIFNEVNKAITSFIRPKSDGINEEELEEYAESVSESFWSDDMEMFDGNPLEKDIYYACKRCYKAGLKTGYRTAEMALSMKESIDEEKLDRLAEQANPYPAYDKSDTCVAHSHDGFNEGFIEGYRAAL